MGHPLRLCLRLACTVHCAGHGGRSNTIANLHPSIPGESPRRKVVHCLYFYVYVTIMRARPCHLRSPFLNRSTVPNDSLDAIDRLGVAWAIRNSELAGATVKT
jgi:hypothetical protein